jgi:hypothetical protein
VKYKPFWHKKLHEREKEKEKTIAYLAIYSTIVINKSASSSKQKVVYKLSICGDEEVI